MAKIAGLVEVKTFFEFETMTQFREEWTALSKDEQEEIKVLVGEELEHRASDAA